MSRTTAEQRRDQIRNAAYQCFRDHGYHETSVDTICEKSSMPDVSWCVLEHPSGCFPMTCRRGKRFTSKVPLAGRGLFLSDGV